MTEMTVSYGAVTLPEIAACSVLLLLVLIMRFKVHAFLALLSVVVALVTGVPFDKIVPTILSGFGSTLAGVALLVGLGAMIGRLLEISGCAKVLAHVNDSGFWLVGRFLEMDEKTTLKTWTVMETLIGTIAFLFALVGSIIL